MSEQNVEIVRRVYDAAARREDASTVLAFYDPEVEWDISHSPARELMGHRIYRGHEGLRNFFREWYEAWETVTPDLEEVIDLGEHTIAVETTRGRGRTSGVAVELPHYSVWTIRQAKIVRVVWFATRADALREAARLSE
jgi:ketosteroid isomerase-like protein